MQQTGQVIQAVQPSAVEADHQQGADNGRRALIRTRTRLEARLLAHRSGWQALDDIRVRKLERALASVLLELGGPDPAEGLISNRTP